MTIRILAFLLLLGMVGCAKKTVHQSDCPACPSCPVCESVRRGG